MRSEKWYLLICALAAMALASVALAQPADPGPPPHVFDAERHDTSAPLHTIRPIPPRAGPLFEIPRKTLPNRIGSRPSGVPDPVVQTAPLIPLAPTPGAGFDGIGNVDGVLPPDTNGDVGAGYYVQTVNLSFAVFDSSNGGVLYPPADIKTLWSGFGGACQSRNDGDPIVLFDHLASRWLISQFALPSFPFGPFYQCIAVSQTSNPTGAWYRYAFLWSNTKLNDYPKFGVWPDGYYMAVNQFTAPWLSWGGQGVAVFERSRMLNGQSARGIKFDLNSTDPNLGGMLPSDLDGPAPPTGEPNYFAVMDDDAWGYSGDQIQIWKFATNWQRTNRTRFTKVGAFPTAAFDSNLCNYARNCIPQLNGTAVDAISDRLMYRLQYRNFGSYQTLVTNHTVDVNGADLAGIRWYELRKPSGGAWNIRQQSTYSPDSATHRWMGSAAMNDSGAIMLGYSASSASTNPSVRVAGRCSGDPLSTLQSEASMMAGNGSQTHSSGRWGDYSMMAVDPNGATFWFTTEYYNNPSGPADWKTRIGAATMTCP